MKDGELVCVKERNVQLYTHECMRTCRHCGSLNSWPESKLEGYLQELAQLSGKLS